MKKAFSLYAAAAPFLAPAFAEHPKTLGNPAKLTGSHMTFTIASQSGSSSGYHINLN